MTEMSKSQTKSPLHLSLTKWSTVKSTVTKLNETYGMSLDAGNYEDRLAIRNEEGLLSLALVLLSTGELDWVIVDRNSSAQGLLQTKTIEHPKTVVYPEVVNNFGILINTEAELDFLKDLRLDVRYDSGAYGANKAQKLMQLLNNYNVGHGWTSNPGNGCTTAYFVPRYFGTGKDAPDVYNFNRNAKLIVVVELLMYGEYQTHALVVR